MFRQFSLRWGIFIGAAALVLGGVSRMERTTDASDGSAGATAVHSGEAQEIPNSEQSLDSVPPAARMVHVPGSRTLAALWQEGDGETAQPFYSISLDGNQFSEPRKTSYSIKLRHGDFDPLESVPPIASTLKSAAGENLFIVQFVTQPLEIYRQRLEDRGVTIYNYLAHHAHIVRMDASLMGEIEELPYVRWVGRYHPAYRVEEFLHGFLREPEGVIEVSLPARRYNIQVFERGPAQTQAVATKIERIDGTVDRLIPDGFVLNATLTESQLRKVITWDEVLFVDRWFAPETDMNWARVIGGADYIETLAGFDGEGVRGEVMDGNMYGAHPDFASDPVIFHGAHSGDMDHGTKTFGINFADGIAQPKARGLLPEGEGIFADYSFLFNRYSHTADLVKPPYNAVFQSNSWGSGLTTSYTISSSQLDDIIFINDIVICQSQSNQATRLSRPEAWAKNVVSVGGVNHDNTVDRSDDCWCFGASIGPAADGRIKPDFWHFYDAVRTTDDNGAYTTSFSGTSAATPITAGFVGLFFDMWGQGAFGNEVLGTTDFHTRAHMTTARAMLANTAHSYEFTGTNHDLTRTHQGWGMIDLGNMFDLREKVFFVDESDLLTNLSQRTYHVHVSPGEPAFKATLVYSDPAGTTSSSLHRINDLTLRVTAPDQTIYYGNNGLLEGNWSTSGGGPNTIDVIENVFVENPDPGAWKVEILADEINRDAHRETDAVDADYALVASGVQNLSTELTLNATTALTKSDLTFEVNMTNNTGVTLGDDEVLENDLRVVLYSGKVARNLSHLLPPIPVLAPGETYSSGPVSVAIPKASLPFIQAVVNAPLRMRSRILVDGTADATSIDFSPVKITQRGGSDQYWLAQNDATVDNDFTDGTQGGSGGNEGFEYLNQINEATDIIATALVVPENVGGDATANLLDYSAADFVGYAGIAQATVGLYRDNGSGRPDLTNPIVEQIGVEPISFDAAGGDHMNQLPIDPAASVSAGELVWVVFQFGSGRGERLGFDNPVGLQSGAGWVDYQRTYQSVDDGATWGLMRGNWIARVRVIDSPGG